MKMKQEIERPFAVDASRTLRIRSRHRIIIDRLWQRNFTLPNKDFTTAFFSYTWMMGDRNLSWLSPQRRNVVAGS